MRTETANEAVLVDELDRLVEDELSVDERRRLIGRLESEPDGWKRCALAFLEAQSWRRTFRAIVEPPADAAKPSARALVPPAEELPVSRHPRRRRRLGYVAALAVLLAAVFAGGFAAGRRLPLNENENVIAGEKTSPEEPRRLADPGSSAGAGPHGQEGLHATEFVGMRPDEVPVHLAGLVRIDGEDGVEQTVPIVFGPGLDEDWLRSRPPALSEYEQNVLAMHGWQVEQDRRLLTVELTDGRRLSVPFDSIQYRFVGDRVY